MPLLRVLTSGYLGPLSKRKVPEPTGLEARQTLPSSECFLYIQPQAKAVMRWGVGVLRGEWVGWGRGGSF